MESLPTTLLTHILQFLSPIDRLRSELVCKEWRDASHQTWRDIQTLHIVTPMNIAHYYRFLGCTESRERIKKEGNNLFIGSDSPKIIRSLVSRVGCFINKLIINYFCRENHQLILTIVSQYCHNLKILDLREMSRCDEELFSRLFEHNKELHSFTSECSKNSFEALPFRNWKSLRLMSGGDREMCEGKIVSLIEHSEALEDFQSGIFTRLIVDALMKLQNLKSLYFTPWGTESLGMILHVPLLNRLRNLEIGKVEMDVPLICNLLKHCSQLERLVITCNYEFLKSVVQRKEPGGETIPDMLLEVILALPMLETLGLCCDYIEDDIVIRLTKFKNLWLVDQKGFCTENAIHYMINRSEVLEKLDIWETTVTSAMFEKLLRKINNRQKYLEVVVDFEIFYETSEICAGSKLRLTTDWDCVRKYTV